MNELVVVTGGAGFIGSHLVEQLVELGQEVRVIERPGADVSHLPRQVDVAWADIRDREALAKAIRGAELIYHLAANPNLWARSRRDFEAVNHQGTVNVLEAALDAGARRVLHTSTESILTRKTAHGIINENVEISESDTVGPYCLSKLRAENAAMALARGGSPVLVANPTMPVGPGDRGLSPPTRLIRDFCRGHLPAIMDCTLNLIDVRDVATGLLFVMERGQTGRRYLLGGENLTLTCFLNLLSKLSGQSVPRWRVPYAAAVTVAYISEIWSDYISGSPPKATVTGVRLARRIMHFDPSRSLTELGLAPRPIHEAIKDALAWLAQTGQIPEIEPGSRIPN